MSKKNPTPQPQFEYGFSARHDAVLDHCRASFGTCPFGCAKDGAPNCYRNSVLEQRCEPGRSVPIYTQLAVI